MAGKVQQEVHRTRPFDSLQQEVFLSLLWTADHFSREQDRFLRGFNLSPTQYNVLRILRGCGEEGLPCKAIGERMLTHDPDITRLLDRLEQRGLLKRGRSDQDRRVVRSTITAEGLKLLAEIDEPIERFYREQLKHVAKGELKSLMDLLEACCGT